MDGFKVYVDESGDEGFVFREDGQGSSRWFVLSAIVTRAEHDLATVKLVDAVRADLRKGPRFVLHFRKLKHEHRLPYVRRIAQARLRTVTVLVNKPSIAEPEKFAGPHALYRYATRFLLERVSWLCRDSRRTPGETAKVVFSNRSSMSYDELRAFLTLLRAKTELDDVRIDWSIIDSERVEARTRDSLMGLQIADAVASSMYCGVERTLHGFTEPRYARMLQPTVYRHEGRQLGYGFKVWPKSPAQTAAEDPELVWILQIFR